MSAPSWARARAMARPIPREAPVTSAVRSASRTDRMAARLQTAHGRNGESAVKGNGPILAEMDALARFGKPGRFQTQRGDDGIRVVEFKEVHILWPDPGLLIGSLR